MITKKIFLLCICTFLAFDVFAESFVNRFGISGNVPRMHKVEYSSKENLIEIKNRKDFYFSMQFSPEGDCVLTVSTKKGSSQCFAKLKKDAIASINSFSIDKKTSCFLICYDIEGATGLSANISSGFLVTSNGVILELSSFGALPDNFVDVNGDGAFEFVCVDLFYDEANRYFVPNVFSLADKVENITDRSKLSSICIAETNGTTLYPKDYKLLAEPKIWRK